MNTDAATKTAETPPRFLYRYLDHHGLDAIYNLELKITPPNEFNDPFEFIPRLADTQQERDAVLRRAQKERPGITWPQVEAVGLKQSLDAELPSKVRDYVSKEFVVLCLSERPDTPTQWAHYANKHGGLMLKLDMDAEPFRPYGAQSALRPLFPRVRYCRSEKKTPQELHSAIEEIEKPGSHTKTLQNILLSCGAEKSPEWCLEKEHRLIRHISTVEHRIVSGRLLHFLRINLNPEVIGQIILGARATDEFEREVRKVASLRGMDNKVVRAELDFKEQVVKIPD